MIHMAKEEVRVDGWNKQEQGLHSGDCYCVLFDAKKSTY